MSQATLHVLQTCPFSWKVRGLVEHLGLDVAEVQVNAMRTKKELSFTNGWNKVPVFTDENGEVVVDSTPIMVYIDEKYNNNVLTQSSGEERYDSMLAHVDEALEASHYTYSLRVARCCTEYDTTGFKTRKVWIYLKKTLRMGRIPDYVGHHRSKTREKGWPDPEETLARSLDRIH